MTLPNLPLPYLASMPHLTPINSFDLFPTNFLFRMTLLNLAHIPSLNLASIPRLTYFLLQRLT